MSDDHVYRVVVTVDEGKWLASVPELEGAHTYEPNLIALDWSVREVIALVEDLQEGAERFLKLSYEFEGDAADKDYLVAGILRERARLRDEQATLMRQTGAAAAHLIHDVGMKLDEAARTLHNSPILVYRAMIEYDPASVAGVRPPVRPNPPQQSPRRNSGVA